MTDSCGIEKQVHSANLFNQLAQPSCCIVSGDVDGCGHYPIRSLLTQGLQAVLAACSHTEYVALGQQ